MRLRSWIAAQLLAVGSLVWAGCSSNLLLTLELLGKDRERERMPAGVMQACWSQVYSTGHFKTW